ncbi:hypothetical protein D3C87_1672950 [compost metagenome]
MQHAVGELRHLGDFGLPCRRERAAIGLGPAGLAHRLERHVLGFHRPDQADPPFDFAIIEHYAGGWDLHGGAAGLLVDQQHGARIAEVVERRIERDRPVALALGDGQQAGLGAGARMGVDHLPAGDGEALGAQRLQARIIGA